MGLQSMVNGSVFWKAIMTWARGEGTWYCHFPRCWSRA